MKKYIFILFCSLLFDGLGAQEKKLVLATASIFADMAENIAGDHLEIKTIVPIGGDPHIYEPTPADAKLISQADIILRNALTFEGWLDDLIESAGSQAEVVTITEGIEAIRSAYKGSADPHAWMDASHGLKYIENIKNAFIKSDPDNKEVYEFNHGVYRRQLEDMDAYIFEHVKKIPEQRRILITSHDAFRYFGQRYGIRLEAVIGISTEAEAQTSDIIRLNKIIKESGVPAVFIETTVNPKLIKRIAEDNNVAIGGSLFSDSIGDENSDAPTYLDMLKFNTDTIVKALSQTSAPAQVPEKEGNGWLMWGVLVLLLAGGFLVVWKKVN
ncbi:MAG: zinc ABC transporter substrate-binding protein [Bacteroidota bacterium]